MLALEGLSYNHVDTPATTEAPLTPAERPRHKRLVTQCLAGKWALGFGRAMRLARGAEDPRELSLDGIASLSALSQVLFPEVDSCCINFLGSDWSKFQKLNVGSSRPKAL